MRQYICWWWFHLFGAQQASYKDISTANLTKGSANVDRKGFHVIEMDVRHRVPLYLRLKNVCNPSYLENEIAPATSAQHREGGQYSKYASLGLVEEHVQRSSYSRSCLQRLAR